MYTDLVNKATIMYMQSMGDVVIQGMVCTCMYVCTLVELS